MESKMEKPIGDLVKFEKLAKLKKDDIVIVSMKEDITAGLAEALVNKLTKTFPDNKSIVLCKGEKLYPLPEKILNDMGWFKKED